MKANRLFLTAIWVLTSLTGVEAKDYIRYVSQSKGAFNKDGLSWENAKANVQDAINDIKDKLEPGDHGYVFVEAGTYKPTQSIANNSGSTLYMSIQIPSGVAVYGGFAGTETGSTAQSIINQRETVSTHIGTYMKNKTVFTGSLSSDAQFSWQEKKHSYNTSFFGNCYHVVWFATNGYETVGEEKHYKALADSAYLDGVVIRDGYAFSSDINKADHIAFGGGAYMVDKAVMRNCEVYHCEASRGGGGIYMDRGGKVENCFVHDCQTLGVNSLTGFGGGISIEQKGLVTHSTLLNNVGRSGGGLSINYDATAGQNDKYAACASACLIAQNVSIVEAGGVYLNHGGLLNGVTIVRNRTYGTGVTLNSIVTGRSGGVYVRDHARIYNSVLWGNQTTAHNTYDLQYASTRSSSSNELKPLLTYVALSKADYTDWSGTKKVGINKLSDEDIQEFALIESFAMFKAACDSAGHINYLANKLYNSASSYIENVDWTPTASSALCYAGLQLLDIVESEGTDLTAGFIEKDLKGNEFNPKCTLGAYTADTETPKDVEIDGVRTLFVDPNRTSGVYYREPGISWDSPMDNLTDALNYFARNGYSGQILVKEGTLYTASRSAKGRLRNTTVMMASNVTVLGGYPRELTGTDLSKTKGGAVLQRNPVVYPTIISGRVVDKDYRSNVAHLVTFDGVESSVLDGIQLRWGNALSTAIADYGKDGAGVRVLNGANATLRNVTIADCTADRGAAIYQESGTLTCENCIFRNNTSATTTASLSGGVLYAAAEATTTFDHCDVVRNVGHAVVGYGQFTSTNSLYYSNMREVVEDTNGKGDLALPVFLGNGSFFGSHNLFDRKSETMASARSMVKVMDKGQIIWLDWTFDVASSTYPRFVNSTKNAGVSEDGDVTYYGREVDYTPSDMNPAVNAASTGSVAHRTGFSDDSWGKDMTTVANRDFGGLPDIGALENGAFTASSATQPAYGTTYYVRDYNTYTYNADGSIASTVATDLATQHSDGTPRNGMSWQNAINGNAVYSERDEERTLTLGTVVSSINNIVVSDSLESIDCSQRYVFSGASENATNRYYIRWDGSRFVAITDVNKADEFIFVPNQWSFDGNNMFRLYDVSQKMFVFYSNKFSISESVGLQDSQWGNTDWQIIFRADGSAIAPAWQYNEPGQGAQDNRGNATGWNIADNEKRLGLYNVFDIWNGSWDNSQFNLNSGSWRFYPSSEKITVKGEFVNGLQYAVNTACDAMATTPVVVHKDEKYGGSATAAVDLTYRNLNDPNKEVSVWVGAGMYTNIEGYKIRNHVKVYGGFPRVGNPGMNERHPQLSYGIPLSSENQSLGLRVQDYETILQTHTSIAERNANDNSANPRNVSVLSHPQECRPTVTDDSNVPQSRVVYEGAEWDGFTMRYGWKVGVIGTGGGRRNGGAGVSLYENVVLRNCVIRENYLSRLKSEPILNPESAYAKTDKYRQSKGRGAGIYCDGSTVENCFIFDNLSGCTYENFGGGLYMIKGTMYNTVVTENRFPDGHKGANHGNGVFFESANFYNNTIVSNHGGTSAIGVWTASEAESHLTVYNSIVMGNDNVPILYLANAGLPAQFDHCFLQTTHADLTCGDYLRVTVLESDTYLNKTPSGEGFNPFAISYQTAVANHDYRISTKTTYNCVNKGTEQLGEDPYTNKTVVLPGHDMDWTRRVQDCRVDIGAYEYNGAGAISPDTDPTRVEAGTAVYYVSELGFGTTQAFDPANAACAEKLQKVLDAAGRYKYDHPDVKVIVKLAGVDATLDGYKESSCFKYYPCRTTEPDNDNVREWSIMVPRGVEVWGGYTVDNVLDKTTNEDIAPCFSENERSVMYHPTFLQTQYDNSSLNETIKGYHVVTFTDKVFDSDGHEIKGANLSSKGFTDRAVLDGLFLVGGQADGVGFGSTASTVNIDQYGGAAIVTDYAHVRNCIVKNNTATYGGALALMNKGLVSGTLIIDNEADYGGGVYVIEDEVTLSNGMVNQTAHGSGEALDTNMPHVYTSTIVKNTGVQQGGGLWFSNDADQPNVRVNSTVLWENSSPDQANVAGQTSPDMPTDDTSISTLEWYPFAYSAVQNQRLSGTSNISVDIQNRQGNRFGVDSMTDSTVYDGMKIAQDTTEVDYYGLTVFSALCRTGMPNATYQALVQSLGLASRDYNKWSRDTIPAESYETERSYIDIGARAYPSSPILDLEHPFLRLYVAETQDVNMDAYQTIQDYAYTLATKAHEDSNFHPADDPNYIYSLLGSSFAFPFHNVDDALTYITALRKTPMWEGRASNMPFEICIARGEYYPQRDMEGNYGYSLANTFLIPEGVTLMGGFDCNDLYGQYLKPRLADKATYTNVLSENVERFSAHGDTLVAVGVDESFAQHVRLIQLPLDSMEERRILEDLNMNNILEPWEFRNQTNLSGNAVNLQNSGVYHVVSVIPYAPGVGELPKPASTNANYAGHEGYQSKYVGQPVIIDGVHISDGYARDYVNGSLTDNGIYDYYRGGGLRANGNWYCESLDGQGDALYHQDVVDAVAYRDIPLYIRNAQFINNQAGYGAAIDANVSTYIYTSLFAENKATSQSESVTWNNKNNAVSYPGNGGAVYFTNRLEAYNTIFSNNEAEDKVAEGIGQISYKKYQSLRGQDALNSFGGAGGALCGGYNSYLKMLNCDVVNNMACIYPAIFTKNPNRHTNANQSESTYNLLANDVFWGNVVQEGVTTGNPLNPFAQALCINYAKASTDNSRYDISLSKAPFSQQQLDGADYVETLWFSGYEDGKAKTSVNMNDMRGICYNKDEYFGHTIQQYWLDTYVPSAGATDIQNANITLSSDNASIDGPNFRNPTTKSGYDGYSEAADWSRARINNLTDNGSCFLKQNVENRGREGYVVSWQTDSQHHFVGDGAYYDTYYDEDHPENQHSMDLGSDIYMRSADEYQNLPRVAADPSPIHTQAYIDLGVYEYPYCRLVPAEEGDAVDILWVSTTENPENGTPDGSKWETPTSDLQRAIETLLSSRNGHRKEIRLMDGEYMPVNTYDDHKAFYINTKDMNNSVTFPEEAYTNGQLNINNANVKDYFVQSLTIKGGYSKDLRDQYDTDLYPAVIRQTERQDKSSETWDYLFLIDDAIQRYGQGQTADGGAIISDDNKATTVPIEIDGVTLVNNQSLPGTHGTAIRYEDQVYTYVDGDGDTHTVYADSPASAYVTISKEEYDALKNDPASGVQVTYWDPTYTRPSATETPYVLYYRKVENPPKVTISKTCVMNSGSYNEDNTSSAVYIGQYGGDALIYNSVFHSNWGNPLEAYNTRTINNTVALNRGRWILKNSGATTALEESQSGTGTGVMLSPQHRAKVVHKNVSEPRKSNIMNTILWRNNPQVNAGGETIYGNQFALDGYVSEADATSENIFKRNAYTYYINGVIDVTEETDYDNPSSPMAAKHWNTHLSLANDNISYGPNFKAPKLEAQTDEEIESRDFSLLPSIRIINKGETPIYAAQVFDLAYVPTTELDFINQPRVISKSIEVGAIEYQQPLLRVLYVDPNRTENGTGLNWGSTINSDHIQDAIDQAALYAEVNTPIKDANGNVTDRNEAYVFVKGNNDVTFPGITLRSGVNVYGSIDPTNMTDYVEYQQNGDGEYIYPHLPEDVEKIVTQRPGLLIPGTQRTTVSSVTTGENNTFAVDKPTRLDGVVISSRTDENPTGQITSPVLDIDAKTKNTASDAGRVPSFAISHVMVADNDASGTPGVNIANINNALIYEVLFRDNKTGNNAYVLNLGERAYGVNLTVEGKTNDAVGKCEYPTTDDKAEDQPSHIWYSIYNYAGKPADENTLSSYNYKVEDPNLNYQLTEFSKNIDRCPATNPMTLSTLTSNLVEFINYEKDVDLLGNPRVLDTSIPVGGKTLDRGAFETWRIGNDATAKTVRTNTRSDVYYGNYYPHEGSVVYLMKNSNLVSEAHELTPCYLLVKQGASLYGHGQSVKVAYVGVERPVKKEGTVVAVPYAMEYNYKTDNSHGPATFEYNTTNGVLTLTPDQGTATYSYNGTMRASARYQIQNSSSPCWDILGAEPVEACQGVLFTTSQSVPYRFTGKGANMKDYIYQERFQTDAEGHVLTTAKEVILTPYNNEPTNGNGDLTAAEDMGWNCLGIPYLVSEYKPYLKAKDALYNVTADAAEYMMHLPKQLWLYYDGAITTQDMTQNSWTVDGMVKNYAGFYAVESWKSTTTDWHLPNGSTPSLWVGEGLFTQTASYTDESLLFYLPICNTASNAAPIRTLQRIYVGDGIEDEMDSDEREVIIYDLQGRRVQNPTTHGIYIVNGKRVWM